MADWWIFTRIARCRLFGHRVYPVRENIFHTKKKHLSVAAPPVCPTYLCSHAYFMISRMRTPETLCMNAHETFVSTDVKYRTERSGQNSKITFFNLDEVDLWPMTLTFKLLRDVIKVNPCTKFCDCTSIRSAVRVPTHWHRHTHTHKRFRFYNLHRWCGR